MARVKPKRQQATSEDLTEVAHTTAQIRAAHRQEASLLQSAVDRITSVIGGPSFVVSLSLGIVLWIVGNLPEAGRRLPKHRRRRLIVGHDVAV